MSLDDALSGYYIVNDYNAKEAPFLPTPQLFKFSADGGIDVSAWDDANDNGVVDEGELSETISYGWEMVDGDLVAYMNSCHIPENFTLDECNEFIQLSITPWSQVGEDLITVNTKRVVHHSDANLKVYGDAIFNISKLTQAEVSF